MKLEQKIEGLLFFKGEPMSIKKLAELLGVKKDEIENAVSALDEGLAERGLALIKKGDEVMLSTKPELGPILEKIRKEELSKELSKASLETISIILYKNSATRSEIDYIRGVNSSFILRNLLVRGLVEKVTHPTDSRRYVYKPTFELLSFMGISKLEELPNYEEVNQALANGDIENAENDSAEEFGNAEQEIKNPSDELLQKEAQELFEEDEFDEDDDFDDEDDDEDEDE